MALYTFEAIGTKWVIEAETEDSTVERAIRERIDSFDKTYSRFRNDSLITRISQKKGTYTFPVDAELLFAFYRELYDTTSGKVTPLVGGLLSDAGYDADYSLQPKETLKPAQKWDDVISFEHPELTAKEPVLLDFGAAGKGYLVDLVAEVLEAHGVTEYLIDAGGDMLHRSDGNEEIRVGLEHPIDPTLAIGIAKLGNGSLCGSAINRRQWAGMHHVMDPDAAASAQGTLADWVTAETAMRADGLATALFFESGTQLKKSFEFEYCVVKSDMSYEVSAGFPAEVFSGDKT